VGQYTRESQPLALTLSKRCFSLCLIFILRTCLARHKVRTTLVGKTQRYTEMVTHNASRRQY